MNIGEEPKNLSSLNIFTFIKEIYASIKIFNKKIDNYQLVVPSTWNASPRDEKGQMSAYETSLIGTPVSDPEQPLELLRTIHSFDPCLACAVHVYDEKGSYVHQIQTF